MKLTFLLLSLWLPLTVWAQTPLQVVTKVVDKELPYTDGQPIRLTGQKADITLRGWNRPGVSVRLRLTTKHPDRSVAERELAFHQYTLEAGKGGLDLSNKFVFPAGQKPQSQLKVSYEVSVPAKALLTITNSFGDISLRNMAGQVVLRFEFGKLTLDEMAGKLNITSSYGDIVGQNVDAALTLKAEKADVSLRDLGGTCQLSCHYGKLAVQPSSQSLRALTLDVARAETTLTVRALADFNIDVITSYGDIRVPEAVADQLGKFNGRQTFTYEPPGRKPALMLKTSYGNVLIQTDKTLVNR